MRVEVTLPKGPQGPEFQVGFLQKLGMDAANYKYSLSRIDFKSKDEKSLFLTGQNKITVVTDPEDDQDREKAARFSVELAHQYYDMNVETHADGMVMRTDSETMHRMFNCFAPAEALGNVAENMCATARRASVKVA